MAKNKKLSSSKFWLPVLSIAVVVFAVAVFLVVKNFMTGDSGGQVIPSATDSPSEYGDISVSDGDGTPLSIRLSEGRSQPQDVIPFPLATGTALSDEEIERILARMEGLTAEPGDSVDFRLPEQSLPPPLTGETIEETFPLQGSLQPEPVETGRLEVLRFAPEGEIPIAPFVNVTFNQPMVPLTTLEDLAAGDVPVQIEPALPGTWRWLGTKTLTFQYDSTLIDRLPMATEYQVTVPAGTLSATGNELAETVNFTFSTPPPTLTRYYPSSSPQPLEPIFFIAFNQRIDPEAVLATIDMKAGNQSIGMRLATEEEIKLDIAVSQMIENAGEARWLAFRALVTLPADTNISVRIGPGTPSAEGPLVTSEMQSFSFQTYAPLRIEDHGCSYWEDICRPLMPLFIEFNNPIDLDTYDDSMLRITPELPGASVNIVGDTITIRGATKGQTTYQVTVSGDIQDIFGQTLGKDVQLKFKIGSADPFLIGPDEIFVTLDPAASDPVLSLYTMNYNKLDLKIYAVEPSDWPDFMTYLNEYSWTDEPSPPPGRLILNETQRIESATDVLTEVGIDLSALMDGDFGHFIVIVEPVRGLFQEDRYWENVQVWVQVTQIGVDAFADHSELTVWSSALQDGSPLAGVTIESDSGKISATTGENGIARFDIPAAGTA